MNIWIEELKEDYFRICLREVKTFDGKHQNLKVVSLQSNSKNWKCVGTEEGDISEFVNTRHWSVM